MRLMAILACVLIASMAVAGCTTKPKAGGSSSSSSSHSGSASASSSGSGSHSGSASSSGSHSSSSSSSGAPANHAPTANVTATPKNGTAPLNVTLALTGTDADGDTLVWDLLFGDGNKTNGTSLPSSVKHQYSKGGNFTAQLTVTDGKDSTVATVKVKIAAGSVGTAAGLDPNCQGAPQVTIPPAGPAMYYIEVRDATSPTSSSQWMYEESNDIPGLQYTQNPGTNPVLGGASDIDPLAVKFKCQNGDTLDF